MKFICLVTPDGAIHIRLSRIRSFEYMDLTQTLSIDDGGDGSIVIKDPDKIQYKKLCHTFDMVRGKYERET